MMDRRVAVISGAVFAGVLGAGIIVSGMTGTSPADAFNKFGVGAPNDATQLVDSTTLAPFDQQASFSGDHEDDRDGGRRHDDRDHEDDDD